MGQGPISQPATPGSSMRDIRWMANPVQRADVKLGEQVPATKCASANNPVLARNGVVIGAGIPPYKWDKQPGASGDNPALIPNGVIPTSINVYDPVVYPCIAATAGILTLPADINLDLTDPYTANLLTTTRASLGWSDDSAGNWIQFANNVARITDKGLLVEEARTNGIRNNSMTGAVAGSPGTLPTNWNDNFNAPVQGVSRNVVGVGTENGIDYIDVRYSGTPLVALGFPLTFESNTAIAGSSGQTWTNSIFIYLKSGSLASVDIISTIIYGYTAGGANTENSAAINLALSSGPLGISRKSNTYSFVNGTTANVVPALFIHWLIGVPVDFTLRIGWPQLEQGTFATSPIRTTAAAVTRAADVVRLTTAPTFGSAYTLYAAGVTSVQSSSSATVIQSDTGVDANRVSLYRSNPGGVAGLWSSGGTNVNITDGAWPLSALGRIACADQAGDHALCFNGGAIVPSNSATMPPSPTAIRFGNISVPITGSSFDGYITQVGVWANARLTDGQLQSLTLTGMPKPPIPVTDLDLTNVASASLLTTVRAGTAYADDLSGVWTSFAANTARITNKGLLVEEARTNSIQNNSMTGAVPGTPGTPPTGWTISDRDGLTHTIVGTGIENGIDYVDIRIFGTTTGTAGGRHILFISDAAAAVSAVATNIQTWFASVFITLVAGTLNNVQLKYALFEYNSSNVAVGNVNPTNFTPVAGALGSNRIIAGRLNNGVATAYEQFYLWGTPSASGVAIDYTLRIGWPQLELGAFATSPIRTTAAAVTRAADWVRMAAPPVFGAASTYYVAYSSAGLSSNGSYIINADDGTGVNLDRLFVSTASPKNASGNSVGGSATAGRIDAAAAFVSNVPVEAAYAVAVADRAIVSNGGVVATSGVSAAKTVAINRVIVGSDGSSSLNSVNGYINRATIWPSVRLSNAELQALTV